MGYSPWSCKELDATEQLRIRTYRLTVIAKGSGSQETDLFSWIDLRSPKN